MSPADPREVCGPVHLRLGTRGSALALAQSGMVADALRELGASVEMVTLRTLGDTRAPNTVWGEGAFVTSLEAALLDGRIDVAVHSAKDVPTTENPRLRIAAYPPREDPRDALVALSPGATLDTLPAGARIGTDSPRRVAFILARRPDLRPHPLHGNVDTRLRRLESGETDALILAVAGLTRLGLAGRISEAVAPDVLPPAPGQGALAVQCRAGDHATISVVERLDDPATRAAVEAERAFLAASGGGCRAPIGALATATGDGIAILGAAADPAGVPAGDAPETGAASIAGATFTAPSTGNGPRTAQRVAWASAAGPVAHRHEIAGTLAARLGVDLAGDRPRPLRVVVTREIGRAGDLVAALQARGVATLHVPTIAVEAAEPGGALDAVAGNLAAYAWVVVTSVNGVEALAASARRSGTDLGPARWAAVGPATAAALERAGARAAFVPATATAVALAEELPLAAGDRILLLTGDRGDGAGAGALRARSADVEAVVAYRTLEGPATALGAARAAAATAPDGFVFTSGSTIRGLLGLLAVEGRSAALRRTAWCIGPSTAAAAREAGFAIVHEAPSGDIEALAALVASSATPTQQQDHPVREPVT